MNDIELKKVLTNVDETCRTLFITYPYFGYVMEKISRRLVTGSEECETAGINSNELVINVDFWNRLSESEKPAIIQHEILHNAHLHQPRFYSIYKYRPHLSMLANIAMDCAINQFIDGLPKWVITIDSISKMVNGETQSGSSNYKVIEPLKSAEYYFNLLQEKQEEVQKNLQSMLDQPCDKCGGSGKEQDGDDCSGCGGSGDGKFKQAFDEMNKTHGNMMEKSGNATGTELDPIEASAMRGILQSAKERAVEKQRINGGKTAGTGTYDSMITMLPSYVKHIKNVWRKLINRMAGEQPVADKYVQYGARNRRNQDGAYGFKRELVSNRVYVLVDVSGSVTDKELGAFVGHISKAVKTEGLIVDLICCDTRVTSFTPNIRHVKRSGIELSGRGGTDLTAAIDFINERENNRKTRAIVLTDGYTNWKEDNIIWTAIYTKNHTPLKGVKFSAVLDLT